MDNIVTDNNSLTYQTLIDTSRELKWPGYSKLKDQLNDIKSPIEKVFRLKRLIDNNDIKPDIVIAANILLGDLIDG